MHKFSSEEAAKIKNKSPLTKKKSEQAAFFDMAVNDEPLSPTSVPCLVQIRLLDGSIQKAQFQSENMLEVVAQYILQHVKNADEYVQHGFCLSVTFPKKIRYDAESIKDANLSPNGTVVVEKLQQGSQGGYKAAEKPKIDDVTYKTFYLASDTKLRGDNPEHKEAFEKRMLQEEIAAKELEKKKKKQDLDRVRAMLRERENKKTTTTPPKPATTTTTTVTAAPTKIVDSCTVRVNLHDGGKFDVTLPPSATLTQVHQELKKAGKVASDLAFSFVTSVPRKTFDQKEWSSVTLDAAKLSPKGVVTVLPANLKGHLQKGTTPAPAPVSNDDNYDYDH